MGKGHKQIFYKTGSKNGTSIFSKDQPHKSKSNCNEFIIYNENYNECLSRSQFSSQTGKAQPALERVWGTGARHPAGGRGSNTTSMQGNTDFKQKGYYKLSDQQFRF